MSTQGIKRALLSVSDKSEIVDLAKVLVQKDVEIVSSGGTAKHLIQAGVAVTPIEEITGNPEAFGGRMKTLSFQVSSGLLFRRNNKDDVEKAVELKIPQIDLVVCNLYPFSEVVKRDGDLDELIENIDIGGPTMVRASAKNYAHVVCLTNPGQYNEFISEFSENGETTLESRKRWSLQAFQHTALYDSTIAWALERKFDGQLMTTPLGPDRATELRYGENPHQNGWVIKDPSGKGLAHATPIQGKGMSYNNYLDADAGWRSLSDLHSLRSGAFDSACTIIKHSNPCGASLASSPLKALELAWQGDPISAFGSIICFNKEVDAECAQFIVDRFVEVVIAPSFSQEAKDKFSKKKNLRLLELAPHEGKFKDLMIRSISGGQVVQEEDNDIDLEFRWVTELKFESDTLLRFGVAVAKHLRSNAIALVNQSSDGLALIGAGMGNPNRLISLQQAVDKAQENGKKDLEEALLISDAFFPFRDNIDLASGHGIKWIIQPGGSIKDNEVIEACDEHKIGMAFTGRRHFRH